jgi:hypothetical protein
MRKDIIIPSPKERRMKVTAWKGGDGATPSVSYGLRIGTENRARYFQRRWEFVVVALDGGGVLETYLTAGFWRSCPELRHPTFRAWFIAQGVLPWPNGKPPPLELTPAGEQRFHLRRP